MKNNRIKGELDTIQSLFLFIGHLYPYHINKLDPLPSPPPPLPSLTIHVFITKRNYRTKGIGVVER